MKYDVIIIGAGISGLSLAHYCLRRGLKTLVLEGEPRIGGCLHSYRFDSGENPFWIELGAHSCFNSYGNLVGIMEDLQLLQRIHEKQRVNFRLLVDGELKSIPSQLRFLELLISLPRLFTLNKAGHSVASYYTKLVGARNYEAVLAPAFDAVICQHSAGFPADLLFRPKRRRRDVMRSFTFAGGLQTLADTIAGQAGLALLTGQEVQTIALANQVFCLSTSDGNHYSASHLGVATPAAIAAKLLENSFPEIAELLDRIRSVAVETVGIVVRGGDVSLPRLGGIIAQKDVFFSVVSRDTVAHPSYRGFTFHIKPGLLDHAGKLNRIREVLGVKTEQWQALVTKDNCLPALSVGHSDLIRELDNQLNELPLALTGNYFTGLSLEDCVVRSASEWARWCHSGLLPGNKM
jgi:protoporphyrinogen oxidase